MTGGEAGDGLRDGRGGIYNLRHALLASAALHAFLIFSSLPIPVSDRFSVAYLPQSADSEYSWSDGKRDTLRVEFRIPDDRVSGNGLSTNGAAAASSLAEQAAAVSRLATSEPAPASVAAQSGVSIGPALDASDGGDSCTVRGFRFCSPGRPR